MAEHRRPVCRRERQPRHQVEGRAYRGPFRLGPYRKLDNRNHPWYQVKRFVITVMRSRPPTKAEIEEILKDYPDADVDLIDVIQL